MKTIVNEISFECNDDLAREFYANHGWVVINGTLDSNLVQNILNQWNTQKNEFANDMGLKIEDYEKEVSQWRDLWLTGGDFERLIFDSQILQNHVQNCMGWRGLRLLHDHLICKPHRGSNKRIPWHQDSMFWPVSLPGCSSWTALVDVGVEDGCLEVIDCSHLDGCDKPVDFMAEERWEFPDDAVRVLLPISSGSTIILHSLTWHRSSPNLGLSDRPAHLALWVHPDSKWRPDLVDWHPLNDDVESNPGERLEGAKFPQFGIIDEVDSDVPDIHVGTIRESGISMFDASKIVGKQISKILGIDGSITTLLKTQESRDTVTNNLIKEGFFTEDNIDDLSRVLNRLWVSHAAYSMHRARNVYNDAYAEWWELVGNRLEENEG